MGNHIEWVEADIAHVSWTTEPGEYQDYHGTENTGPALAFAGIVVEGTVEALRKFAADIESAVNEMEDDGETDEVPGDSTYDWS